jgi:hypothetical protein
MKAVDKILRDQGMFAAALRAGTRVLGHVDGFGPVYPIFGAERGYSTEGDVVPALVDGTPTNDIWAELQTTLQLVNESRDSFTAVVTRGTTRAADAVVQAGYDSDEFEEASEFGVPKAIAAAGTPVWLGNPFADYDLATRFTWRFLRDATAEQIVSVHNRALAADNKLINNAIMRRLFDPTPGVNSDGRTVYGLYSGDDMVPTRYLWNTFAAGHSHLLTTGSATIDGGDLSDARNHIIEHGYGTGPNSRLLLFVHPEQLEQIAVIRVGDDGSPFDFVPSRGAPPWLAVEQIVNPEAQAPALYNNLQIAGSWGDVWVAEHGYVPPGYVVMVATGGPNSDLNPISIREHANPVHQGLRLIPGGQQRYPLIESFYSRGFGIGVRHRGAAVVMQITASSTYTPPSQFL